MTEFRFHFPLHIIWCFRFKDTFLWRRKSISAAKGDGKRGLQPCNARATSCPPLVVLQVGPHGAEFVAPDAACFRRDCAYIAGLVSAHHFRAILIQTLLLSRTLLLFFIIIGTHPNSSLLLLLLRVQLPRPTSFSFYHHLLQPNGALPYRHTPPLLLLFQAVSSTHLLPPLLSSCDRMPPQATAIAQSAREGYRSFRVVHAAAQSQHALDQSDGGELPACFKEWASDLAQKSQVLAPISPAPPPKVTKIVLEGADYAIVDVNVQGTLTLQVWAAVLLRSRHATLDLSFRC